MKHHYHPMRTTFCIAASAVLSLAVLSGCDRRAAEPPAPTSNGSAGTPPATAMPDATPSTTPTLPATPPASDSAASAPAATPPASAASQ